ncbi:MAG: hypothetical protein QG657_441 [Acidobacteriota bacterium]|nr:hypothetical protein [Acidobacteriota bacterium]
MKEKLGPCKEGWGAAPFCEIDDEAFLCYNKWTNASESMDKLNGIRTKRSFSENRRFLVFN